MGKEEIVDILADILGYEKPFESNEFYVDAPINDPMGDGDTAFYRYAVAEDETIQVKKWENGSWQRSVTKDLRSIVWQICKLERVCNTYRKHYVNWALENNGIPYIETNITDESDGRPERSYEFMRKFWTIKDFGEGNGQNLRLLLAEYGVGKSSFCQGIRILVAGKIRSPFLEGSASFPFVFDLNEFRTGDIDKFIETELHNKYGISMTYRIFEALCQKGIFMVVLDAWDQMGDARQIFPINQSLNQISPLWERQGKVLITCRRSFYQQQLKGKGREKSKFSQDVGLYKLAGFDRESVIDYFRRDAEERERNGREPLLSDEIAWVEECWELNSELFGKPLNLRLLVKHFDAISGQIKFSQEKADTYRFLEIVLEDWKEKANVTDELFLKKLVSLTLLSGLNRSIPLRQFREACDEKKWDGILKSLQAFDFVKISDREERIEFCLAAFQEFLWAHFVLKELKTLPEDLDNQDALIRNYLLIREVREWICKVLGGEESECLAAQLQYVKYKSRKDVGYRGANALTLLCDLNRRDYYKKQLDGMKSNLRRSPLMGTDFHGLDLSGADFYGSDLEGADFSYTKLDQVDFGTADLAQTRWREHERMTKCAFLIQENVLCVVAGTTSGGVLTYRIDDGTPVIVDLQNDVINDLAGDRGGIYTASSDGWVGYMDKSGNLRNAYIAQNGLQSITYSRNESCIYVGADHQGIFRYDWHTGSRQEIKADRSLGDGMDRISDIHYYSNEKEEDYIAYTLSDKKLLVLLQVTGKNEGKVKAICKMQTERYRFSDICFADDLLVYTVIGEGIFGMPVEEAIGEIPERELLLDSQRLLSLPDADSISLSWANECKTLMAVAKSNFPFIEKVHAIHLASDSWGHEEIDLDWIWSDHNYHTTDEQMGGFGVSGDGRYVAFSGDFLAVYQNMGSYYALIDRPIEAKISCKKANFSDCRGMNPNLVKFVKERGAKFEEGDETNE